MGLLDEINLLNKPRIKQLTNKLCKKCITLKEEDEQSIRTYINNLLRNKNNHGFYREDVFCDVVEDYIDSYNRIFFSKLKKDILIFEKIYDILVLDDSDIEQIKLFKSICTSISYIPSYDLRILLNLFNNKEIYLSLISYLGENFINSNYLDLIVEYIKKARQYYVDENAFLSSIIEVCDFVNGSSDDFANEFIEKKLKEDKISSGNISYDSDELDASYRKISEIESGINELMNKVKLLRMSSDEIEEDLEKRMNDNLKKVIDSFVAQTKNDVKKLEKAKKDFLILLKKEHTNINDLANNYIQVINEKMGLVPEKHKNLLGDIELEADEIPVNRYLDSKIPFKQRIEMVKESKDPNKLYHYAFDRILNQILMNKPVMLIGPSGSGKSYTAKQIADLLGLKLYNFGFVSDEITAIKGYNDYQGNFVATPFYEIYKNGGLCFFDEVDNSESKALMELNKIIGSNGYEPYLFPNGEIIKPHPNFRIIAAGNTWGDGADSLYSTRERLDATTLNRFALIDYGYDKKIEKKILKKYLDMYEFTNAFRNYIDSRHYDDIISTRDMEDIRQYLDNGISIDEILDIKFIKNKEIDALNSISTYIDENLEAENKVNNEFKKKIANRKRRTQ